MRSSIFFKIILFALTLAASCSLKEPLDYCKDNFEPDFEYTFNSGDTVPVKVFFINKTKNLSYSSTFIWYVDDFRIDSSKNAFHIFTKQGIHDVKLVVSNCSGSSKQIIKKITTNSLKFSKPLNNNLSDIGTRIKSTSDGNFITCGITDDSMHMWIGKIDKYGKILWSTTLKELGIGEARDIIETRNKNYILCGTAFTTKNGVYRDRDVIIAEFSTDGNKKWSESYGGMGADWGFSVKETRDGGFIVTGCTNGTPTLNSYGNYDLYLLKLYSNGSIQWEKNFGGAKYDCGSSVLQDTTDDSYIVCGATESFGNGGRDGYWVKTNSAGEKTKEKTYFYDGIEEFRSINITKEGKYMLAGFTTSKTIGARGGRDVFVLKIDKEGEALWPPKSFGGVNDDEPYDLIQTSDGGTAIIGSTESIGFGFPGSPDAYLIKIDKEGKESWPAKTFEDNKFQRGASLVETPDCGFMIFGTTKINANKDFLVIKTDETGKK